MSVTDTIFGRRGLAVPDDVCNRNGSGTNIDVQTLKVGRLSRCADIQGGQTFKVGRLSMWLDFQDGQAFKVGRLSRWADFQGGQAFKVGRR
jgi:hypothetical protein